MRPAADESRRTIEIRSFRTVFRLERRIYKFDRWRIPIPYGVPVWGLAYSTATLAAIVLAGRLPAVGGLVSLLPAPLRFVLLPLGVGALLNGIEPDGRRPHIFIKAWLRHRLGARCLCGLRP